MRILVALAVFLGLVACGEAQGVQQVLPSDKVFICKYVGTPGVDERLQTGQNPISTSINSIPAGVPIEIGSIFADEQGRSIIIAFDTGQPEPGPEDCPTPGVPPTTVPTTEPPDTTGPPTTPPTPSLFAFSAVVATCPDGEPLINITFPARPELNGQVGTLSFSTGGSIPLTFISGVTVQVPYPDTTADVDLTYVLGAETATASVSFPAEGECLVQPTTVPTTPPPGTTTTLPPGGTTTTAPPGATTTLPPGATTLPPGATTTQAGTTTTKPPFSTNSTSVCVVEVATAPGC